MAEHDYVRESLDTIFETAEIDYLTDADAPGSSTYAFTAWPDPDDDAVEDAGRYLAVVDAMIEDRAARHRVYDRLRTDGGRCYLPDSIRVATVADDVLEQDGMKQRALQEFTFDPDTEEVFVAAYEEARAQLEEQGVSFKG